MKKRIVFSSDIEDSLFDLVDLERADIKLALDQTKLNKSSWFQRNRPIYFLMFFTIRSFKLLKMEKEMHQALMFLSTIIYSGRQQNYFPYNNSTAFNAAMDYTVNNISDKFLIKQKGSVYAAIESIATTMMKTYENTMKDPVDKDVIDWVMNLYNRINQFVQIFANAYYDNYEHKRYINAQQSISDEGDILNVENQSVAIQRLSEKAYLKTRINTPDSKIVRLCASSNSIPQIALKNTIVSIYKNETEELKKMITLILMIFLVDEKKKVEDIHSATFILTSLKAYTKSNTREPNVINLKKVITDILEKNSAEFNKTERTNTKMLYKRAVFQYFVMLIQTA